MVCDNIDLEADLKGSESAKIVAIIKNDSGFVIAQKIQLSDGTFIKTGAWTEKSAWEQLQCEQTEKSLRQIFIPPSSAINHN